MPSSDPTRPPAAVTEAAPPAAVSPDAQAMGRRILSTAFVRVGPDGYLTVEEHGGRTLVLRDVAMNKRDYCGIQASADGSPTRTCAAYEDVAAARPGGGPLQSR